MGRDEKPSRGQSHELLICLLLLAIAAPVAEAQTPPAPPNDFLTARAIWLVPHGPEDADPGIVDPWFGRDKALHFGASFLITLSGQYVLEAKMHVPPARAWPVAASSALTLGLLKELADSQRARNPHFSWRDMAWNTAGVAVAVGVILL